VKENPPTRKLREHPDLDQLRRQAKELLRAFGAGDADAASEVNAHYRDADAAKFALHDAQLVLARSHGFESWPKLKADVDGATVKRLAEAVRAGDIAQVRAMVKSPPELVHMDVAHNDEHRALHYAVLDGAPEMVRQLMQHGADARKGIYPHSVQCPLSDNLLFQAIRNHGGGGGQGGRETHGRERALWNVFVCWIQ
jgi:hypothetical protein